MRLIIRVTLLFICSTSFAQTNLLDTSSWTAGTGSVTGFSHYDTDVVNVREMGVGPHGNSVMLWKRAAGISSSSGGGFNTDYISIDHTKTYRYTVWIKKTNSDDGRTIVGIRTKDISDSSIGAYQLNDYDSSNPYFWVGDNPSLDTWYLVVGYVHSSSYTGTTNLGGIYLSTDGSKNNSIDDFKFKTESVTINCRNYLYDATNIDDSQFFYDPRLYEVNGQEPTIQELIDVPLDTQVPTAPTLSSTSQTDTTVDLSWTAATDNVAVTGYKIYKDGVLETTLGNVLTYQVTGLNPLTSYDFTVTALDLVGNESITSNTLSTPCNISNSFSNSNGGAVHSFTYNNLESVLVNFYELDNSFQMDIDGVTIHSNVLELQSELLTTGESLVVFQSDNSILSAPWIANSNGLPRIQIQIDNSGAISLKGTRYTDSTILENLTTSDGSAFNTINFSNGEVEINVTNFDESGADEILGSIMASQNCSLGTDTQVPTAPTLSSTSQTDTTVDLSWIAATDNVAVTGYKVYKDDVLETTLGNVLTYQVTGLTASTAYNFTVTALDAEGNESIASNILEITTNTVSGGGSGNWILNNQDIYYNVGNVGIGTSTPDEKLAVNGSIHTKEVRVDLDGWSDFVFEKEYKLPTLKEVEQHIKEKGHLKDIPSAKNIEEHGVLLGDMNAKLLQKIEELTLYAIQQKKEIQKLKRQNSRILKQEKEISELKLLVKKLIESKK